MAGPAARRWGWHPLLPQWAERIVAESPVRRGDVVVDLGAGAGALTRPLAQVGARVLAVELHAARAEAMRAAFTDSQVAVLEVAIADFSWPGRPFRVVANPPYDGVNGLVRALLRDRNLLSADLVVAEGAARGLLRRTPCAGLELGPRVPRSAFAHRPPGDACVLRIRRSGRAPRPGSRPRSRSRR